MTEGPYRHKSVTRLSPFGNLSPDEVAWLKSIAGPMQEWERGQVIGGSAGKASLHLLLEGWASSAIILPDGTRQLIGINLPGDLLGLPGLSIAQPLDTLLALSPVKVRGIPVAALSEMFSNHPRLAAMLFLISQEERMRAMERLTLMGQVEADVRLAALLVRLSERLGENADAPCLDFEFPLRQLDLADLIGVSLTHLNGVLQSLRAAGLIHLSGRRLRIADAARLRDFANIEPWWPAEADWLPDPPDGKGHPSAAGSTRLSP